MGKLDWFGAPSIDNRGNVAVGLAAAAGLGLAVTGVLLSQSVNQSLRKIASGEGEQALVNYAKKRAAITAAMTTSTCSGPAATVTFTAEPVGTADSGLHSRCFTTEAPGSEKILQACKVCTPGQAGYQVVSVQLPAPEVGACGAAGANRYCACTRLTNLHLNFDYVESRMAPYLRQPGNMNLAANEMPIPG